MKIVETKGKYRVLRKMVLEVGDLVAEVYPSGLGEVHTITRTTYAYAYASYVKFTKTACIKGDPSTHTFQLRGRHYGYGRPEGILYQHLTKKELSVRKKEAARNREVRFKAILRGIREDMKEIRLAIASGKPCVDPFLTP